MVVAGLLDARVGLFSPGRLTKFHHEESLTALLGNRGEGSALAQLGAGT